eukprot:TRINITY_DN3507_c0_g1_i2.p1 TRINITY_DN3507_c0_g1~~TRINITY_DN3507_c0_g1_i2.p1  ORF type:complete len:139 (+),score=23.15 TRINITY_DN3507_c0_g1_i2:377-793(+)
MSQIHRVMMTDLLFDAGPYRQARVILSGSSGMVPPNQCKAACDPIACIDLATKFMHRFTVIHPYADGNGRMSRILFNLLLLQHGHPLTIFHPRSHRVYLESLTHADQGSDDLLSRYTLERVNQPLDEYLSVVTVAAAL